MTSDVSTLNFSLLYEQNALDVQKKVADLAQPANTSALTA